MGGSASKEEEDVVFNPRLIAFDEDGNLRYGVPERDRDDEMLRIMKLDEVDGPSEESKIDAVSTMEAAQGTEADGVKVSTAP